MPGNDKKMFKRRNYFSLKLQYFYGQTKVLYNPLITVARANKYQSRQAVKLVLWYWFTTLPKHTNTAFRA